MSAVQRDPNQLVVEIHKGGAGISHAVDVPPSFWEKWYTVSFQFKETQKGLVISGATASSGGMIWVKERWYHRLWSWFYFKMKGKKGVES